MKRLVNFRLSLLCALGVVGGILSFYCLLFGNVWVFAVTLTLLVVATVVFALLKRKIFAVFLVLALFLLVGFSDFAVVYANRDGNGFCCKEVTLTGRVTDIGRNGTVQNTVYLEKCVVDGVTLDGRIKMYVYDGTVFDTGDTVTLHGTLRNVYAVQSRVDTFAVRNNVRYEMSDVSLLQHQSGALTLGEKVRRFVYETTSKYMPENGDIAYALLTGDRNAVDSLKEDAFISAGIIHLLAVSGLHVGFVIAIFGFFLRKLRLPTFAELLILLVPLCFYAYVCNFTPSVLRAVIMAVCVYAVRIVYGRYDLLSSLCWAATIILVAQPLFLFDVGFQLSVTSVFGIATVHKRLSRVISKIPNKFAVKALSSLALSFSCIVATFFLNAYYFSSVAVAGLVVNVVAIPLTLVAFVLCFAGLVPFLSQYVLAVGDRVLQAVSWVAQGASKLDASLNINTVAVAIPVFMLVLFAVGGFVRLGKGKKIFYPVCGVILALCVAVTYIPQRSDNAVSAFFGYDDTVVVATSPNETVIVADFDDEYCMAQATDFLSQKRVDNLVLAITNCKDVQLNVVRQLCDAFDVARVYLLDSSGNTTVQNFLAERGIDTIRTLPNRRVGGNITIQPVYDGGLCAVVVKVGNITVANVVCDGVKAQNFAGLRSDIDYYLLREGESVYCDKNLPNLSVYQQNSPLNFGANKYGNFTIKEKDGNILLNFR